MGIKLSRNLTLPGEAVTWKMALLGRTGSGKTNTAVVMAEHMIRGGLPIAILDPQGDWWGLRTKHPIAILGGEHGDVPIEPSAGQVVAEFVVAHRHPVLIDLFGMGEAEMIRFATDFAATLWRSNREALHLFVDEADLFAPQKCRGGPQAKCLGAWQNVVRRGRSRGLGCTMITQRSAVLNKDLLTQADPVLVHRLTASHDLAAVDEYLKFNGYESVARRRTTMAIGRLERGEAFVLSPGELQIDPTPFNIYKRKSYDSSATPESGVDRSGPRAFAQVDLAALTESMAATVERAKENDPKELKRRVAELQKEASKHAIDQRAIDSAVATAVAERDQYWRWRLREVANATREHVDALSKRLAGDVGELLDNGAPPAPKPSPVTRSVSKPKAKPVYDLSTDATEGRTRLSSAQQRILDAVAWWEGVGVDAPTNVQIGAVAMIDASGGYFSSTVGPLSTAGLVERARGSIRLTDAGRQVAQQMESIGTLSEYHEMLRSRVRRIKSASGATVRILDSIIAAGGASLTNEQVGESTGIDHTGGYFSNSIGPLSTIGLVARNRGVIRPTELLFPPGVP